MTRQRVALVLVLLLVPAVSSEAVITTSFDDAAFSNASAVPPKLAAAVDLYRHGKLDNALQQVREFLTDHPDSAAGYELAGAAALALGRFKEAEDWLGGAVRLDPRRATSMALLGQLAAQWNDPASAEQWYRQALALSPKLRLAQRGHAWALLHLGRLQEAAEEARYIIALSGGKDVEVKQFLAGIYHELGHHAEAEALLNEVLAAAPTAQEALVLQGMVKLDLEKFDEAAALLKQVTQRNPRSTWARLGLSIIARLDGRLEESRAILEQLLKEQSDWALAHFQLGETLLAQEHVEAALTAFQQSARLSPNPSLAHLRAGAAFVNYGAGEQAIAEATQAVESPETSATAWLLLVQAHLVMGHADAAEKVLKYAMAANPADASWAMQLGRFYLREQRPQEALVLFNRVATRIPPDPAILAAQAEAHASAGNAQAAIALATQVVELQGRGIESMLFLGAMCERLGALEEAEQSYQRVLDQAPLQLMAGQALAALYARTNRPQQALALLEKIVEAHPEAILPRLDIAHLHEQAGHPDEAIAMYRQVLKRDRHDPFALNNFACLLSQNEKSLDEALRLAEHAYRLAPGNPQMVDTLGWISYLKGDLNRAQALLTRAVHMLPGDPTIHYHLGMMYLKQGKQDAAHTELSNALQAPHFLEANQARAALASLR